MRTWIISLVVPLLFANTVRPQQVTIQQTPIQKTSWASGPVMYGEYCAACHGNSGHGRGPAARAFKAPPADLTTLAQRNGGKFPYDKFDLVMRFGTNTAAHASVNGSKAMPVWGPLFASLPGGSEAIVHQRISNLADYVASLQAK
jgi:mono/diheme cytochrome c family protein